MNPILASRFRWRTTAAACLGTHDETSLCSLAARSCTDASSMDASSGGRAVMAWPQSTEVQKGASTGKIQRFRVDSISPTLAAPSLLGAQSLRPVLVSPTLATWLPVRPGGKSNRAVLPTTLRPRRGVISREELRRPQRLTPVDEGCV